MTNDARPASDDKLAYQGPLTGYQLSLQLRTRTSPGCSAG